MKRKFPSHGIVLIFTRILFNIALAQSAYTEKIEWNEISGVMGGIIRYSHYISAAFMTLSLLFFHKLWSFWVNNIFLIPLSFTSFGMTLVMCFIAGPFGLIIPLVGILDLCVFFSRDMRAYFGFEVKELTGEDKD